MLPCHMPMHVIVFTLSVMLFLLHTNFLVDDNNRELYCIVIVF